MAVECLNRPILYPGEDVNEILEKQDGDKGISVHGLVHPSKLAD